MPVAVAAVASVRVPGAIVGAADGVGLRRQQRVDEAAHQLPQQIRAGLSQLVIQEASRVDTGIDGHRGGLHSRVLWKVHSKDHPVTVTYIGATRSPAARTPLCRTQLPQRGRPMSPDAELRS